MARKTERDRTSGSGSSQRGSGGGRKTGGARKTSGARKTAGARQTAAARKAAAARKSEARTAAGAAKTAGSRKAAGAAGGGRKPASRKGPRGKSEAREMAQPRGGAAKIRTSGRAAPRRAAGRSSGRGRGTRARAAGGGYSASTQRALWIESPDQHAERPGQTLATRNHDVIRQWAEQRGAVPATIAGTERDGRPGVLRFDFPDFGRSGGRLRQVDWDEWFETFDQRNLVFLFQEQMKSGTESNFFRLDSPDREEG